MKAKSRENRQKNFLYPDLLDQLNPPHPLRKLANRIPWQRFEDKFAGLSNQAVRPTKPMRLMVDLMWCLFGETEEALATQSLG